MVGSFVLDSETDGEVARRFTGELESDSGGAGIGVRHSERDPGREQMTIVLGLRPRDLATEMAALGSGPMVGMLQEGISARQHELQNVADILARAASKYRSAAAWVRTLLIFCGALAATQGAWEQAFAEYKGYGFLVFTLLGVVITGLAGLEAAFKFEAKGAELNLLAASCHSTVRRTDATWYRQVGIAANSEEQIKGAMSLIELQDAKLSEIQEKAAASGVNITLEVRSLYRGTNERSDSDAASYTGHGPYAA